MKKLVGIIALSLGCVFMTGGTFIEHETPHNAIVEVKRAEDGEEPIVPVEEEPIVPVEENEDESDIFTTDELVSWLDQKFFVPVLGVSIVTIISWIVTAVINIVKNNKFKKSAFANSESASKEIMKTVSPLIENRMNDMGDNLQNIVNENKEMKSFLVSAIALMQENTPEARLKVLEMAKGIDFSGNYKKSEEIVKKEIEETKETISKIEDLIKDENVLPVE